MYAVLYNYCCPSQHNECHNAISELHVNIRVELHNDVDHHSPNPHLLAISNRTWPRSPERTGSGCLYRHKVMCCGHLWQAINSLPWRHWHNYHCARHQFRCGEDKGIQRKNSNNITAMRGLRKALGSREQSNTSAFVRDRIHIPMAEACDSFSDFITKNLQPVFYNTNGW